MNIRDLRYLVALAQTQHFHKAAKACFVSQPTLSMQIKKLEEHLGVPLFERDNKTVQTTLIGQSIIEQAHVVLDAVAKLEDIAKEAQNPYSGIWRIGMIPTIAPYFLPSFLQQMRENLPDITLQVIEEKSHNLLTLLKEGKLDAAFIALPFMAHPYQEYVLFSEDFFIAMAPEHALAQHKTVSIKDLKPQEILLLEEGHCLRDQTLHFCNHSPNIVKPGFHSNNLETIKKLVINNHGVCLLPKMACDFQDPKLQLKPLKENYIKREIALICKKNGCHLQVVQAVCQWKSGISIPL